MLIKTRAQQVNDAGKAARWMQALVRPEASGNHPEFEDLVWECTLRPPLRRMSGRQQPLRLRRFRAAACTTCCACILNVLLEAHRKTRDC